MNENETNTISKMSIKVIGGGVYLKNKPQTITITWEIKDDNGNIITPDTLSVNNIPLDPTTTSKTYHRVFSDVDFTVRAVKDGALAIGTTTARFVGPTQTVEDSLDSNSRSIAASANSVRLLNEKIENNNSFKGLFTSLDDLKKKLRSGNNGDWAIVGEGIPAPIYIWNKNGWEATGGQYTGSTIDLDSYYTKESVADYTDDYNVSKNHSHIVKIYDTVNWQVVPRNPEAPVYQLGQSYDAGEVVNMTDDNDSSYECLQSTITAPYLSQDVRSFTLAEAISFLPEDLRVTGQKISFLSSELNAWMTYVFTGGDYTNPTYWEIFTNNIDPDTNQKIADLQAKDEDLQNQINEDVTNLNNHIAKSDAKFEEIDNTLTEHEDRMDDIEDEILLSSVEAACAPKDVEILADRAYKDHLGNIIADEYITRDTLTEEIIDITNQQVTDLKPGSVQPEDLSEAVKQMIGCKKITNLPDEEDITVTEDNTLKFKDREYSPKDYSGMGKKILRKHYIDGVNTLTQHMINKPNTIYVIRYDYCLQGQTIEIPENCVLEFDGGSLRNGKIIFNHTYIKYNHFSTFVHINISGIIENSTLDSRVFADVNQEIFDICYNSDCMLYLYSDITISYNSNIPSIYGNNNCIFFDEEYTLINSKGIKLSNLNFFDNVKTLYYNDNNVVSYNPEKPNLLEFSGDGIRLENINFSSQTEGNIRVRDALLIRNSNNISINNLNFKNIKRGVIFRGSNSNVEISNINFYNISLGIFITTEFDLSVTSRDYNIHDIIAINTLENKNLKVSTEGNDIILIEFGVENVNINNIYGEYLIERAIYAQSNNTTITNVTFKGCSGVKLVGHVRENTQEDNSTIVKNGIISNIYGLFYDGLINEAIRVYHCDNIYISNIILTGSSDVDYKDNTSTMLSIGNDSKNVTFENVKISNFDTFEGTVMYCYSVNTNLYYCRFTNILLNNFELNNVGNNDRAFFIRQNQLLNSEKNYNNENFEIRNLKIINSDLSKGILHITNNIINNIIFRNCIFTNSLVSENQDKLFDLLINQYFDISQDQNIIFDNVYIDCKISINSSLYPSERMLGGIYPTCRNSKIVLSHRINTEVLKYNQIYLELNGDTGLINNIITKFENTFNVSSGSIIYIPISVDKDIANENLYCRISSMYNEDIIFTMNNTGSITNISGKNDQLNLSYIEREYTDKNNITYNVIFLSIENTRNRDVLNICANRFYIP